MTEPLLSICIPTLPVRYGMLARLLREIHYQVNECGATELVEILTDDAVGTHVGMKRRVLYMKAKGKYICCVDDDDTIYPYYIKEILAAIESDPDVVGTNGIMTWDGRREQKWFISIKNPYEAQTRFDGSVVYARFPNHLSPVRAAIARQFPFIDVKIAEDYDYAKKLNDSGLLKTEVCIGTTLEQWMIDRTLHAPHKPLYHYRFVSNKG